MAWVHGTMNLKPGVLRRSQWTKDFNPFMQHQTQAQIWIRLMDFPRAYWKENTLREISGSIRTPLIIDSATQNRHFGHYARILIDMDLSKHIFEGVLAEREGYAFNVEVVSGQHSVGFSPTSDRYDS